MIHIITPCARPENLHVMKSTVPASCSWVIVLDQSVTVLPNLDGINATVYQSPHTGVAGHPNRNFALDHLQFSDLDWIYFLDDDNIMHPNWYERVLEFQDEQFNMISWGQVWKNGSLRLAPTLYPRVGTIDMASYMVRGRLMKRLRFAMDYCADGILAEQAASYGGYLCLNEPLCYYNYLRTPPDRE